MSFPVAEIASSLTDPRKTCDVVCPSLLTSTPNSVPRSVTVAVGVRTANKGLGIRDWGLDPLHPRPSPPSGRGETVLLFQLCRQLADRQKAPGDRFHLVRHRP